MARAAQHDYYDLVIALRKGKLRTLADAETLLKRNGNEYTLEPAHMAANIMVLTARIYTEPVLYFNREGQFIGGISHRLTRAGVPDQQLLPGC